MDENKVHIRTPMGEVLIGKNDLDPAKWIVFEKIGLRLDTLWVHPDTGASIALLEFAEGAGVPEKHTHHRTSSCIALRESTSTRI